MIKRLLFLIALFPASYVSGYAQLLSNLRQQWVPVKSDTLRIDSVSIIPGSAFISNDQTFVPAEAYTIDYAASVFYWNKTNAQYRALGGDSLLLTYRVFPVLLTRHYSNKNLTEIEKRFDDFETGYVYEPHSTTTDFFKMPNLSSQGSISRAVSFGNNQDAVVNSSLNLQLAGSLNKTWEIAAAITDNNLPVQPEGNTQQLQDFDKVYIQLSNGKSKIIAGDFDLMRPASYFMNFRKKLQGALASANYTSGQNAIQMRTTASASISRGKYARNIIEGIEANQGPYRLIGADNETYIVVLSGTERVFVNGELFTRGQEYDYVIDYNTAEVTFTSNRIITKDSRLIIEFQYTDKNYVRTLLYANHEMDFAKANVRFNIYSETDLKNQPLLQSLDDSSKLVLSNAGDSLQYAIIPNADSIAYNNTEVLYKKTDTIVSGTTYTIYVYSTSEDSAFYRVGFSYLGLNKGNYIQVPGSANGRVFQWVVPLNGLPQGSYEPVEQLIAPAKKMMMTLAADVKLNGATTATVEGAFSQNKVNLFSEQDAFNDLGYAIKMALKHDATLKKDSLGNWAINAGVNYEGVQKHFSYVEAYRSAEFNRDWNLLPSVLQQPANENIIDAAIKISKAEKQAYAYQFKTLLRETFYKGFINALSVGINTNGFKVDANGSWLISRADSSNTNFIRTRSLLSKTFGKIIAGIKHETEHNEVYIADSLSAAGLWFDQFGVFAGSSESVTRANLMAEYFRRYDKSVMNNRFEDQSFTDNISITARFMPTKNSTVETGGSYRNLVIDKKSNTSQMPSETFLAKVNYNQTLFKGSVNFNGYYEAGSGLQQKLQYAFIEVASGTGVYTWTDYNGNNVKELNEFDVAVFQDQANYNKVFTPTNEYIRTLKNQISAILNLNPAAGLKQTNLFGKVLGKLSNQTAYRSENQTGNNNIAASLNPFITNLADTSLSLSTATFRNTFYYNRSSTEFGAELTWQNLHNKILTPNGFELRRQQFALLNIRYNLFRFYNFVLQIENGVTRNSSEYFANRNYDLPFKKLQPVLSYQPGNELRITLLYSYEMRENTEGAGNESATQNNGSVELKYSSVKKGIATFRINLIQIDYKGEQNSPIAYEMLNGLQNGRNITWTVNLQRNLSRVLQISVNYEGRQSQGNKTIHTAGVQARAFF